jgi:hypothetical protein
MAREANSEQGLPDEAITRPCEPGEARNAGRQVEANETHAWLDDVDHAAFLLSEVRDEILSAYHAGQETAPEEWRVMATLNGLASYVDHMRTALTVMHNGGLRETGNGRWFMTDGATDSGPHETLAEALEARERFEENGETFMVYEQAADPDDVEAAGQ